MSLFIEVLDPALSNTLSLLLVRMLVHWRERGVEGLEGTENRDNSAASGGNEMIGGTCSYVKKFCPWPARANS
jgi:hypothetical protein